MMNTRKCKICAEPLLSRQKQYCSNKCKWSDPLYKNIRRGSKKTIRNKIAVCNTCGFETKDVENFGGHAKKHIVNVHSIPFTSVSDHYELRDIEPVEYLECPLCDWKTKDLQNKSGCVTRHFETKHGMNPTQIVELFPNLSHLYNKSLEKIDLQLAGVECMECGEMFEKITNSHLKNVHEITTVEYKEKWPDADIISNRLKDLHSEMASAYNLNREFKRRSSYEIDLENWLYQFFDESEVLICDRSFGTEFDLYIPTKKLAIEIDGFPFHFEEWGKHRTYHLDKTNIAEKNEIHLIHIFGNEWVDKNDIVLNKLRSILGVDFKKTLGGRNVVIHSIDTQVAMTFLEQNHIQGKRGGKWKLGAYYNDELVAVLVVGHLRKSLGSIKTKGAVELIRYSALPDYQYAGVFSKMLTHFLRANPSIQNVISYADRRWTKSVGNLYEKSNFTLHSITKPSYWYFDKDGLKSRYMYTKHRIVNELGGDPTLSESENMAKFGIPRVWDCGTLKYVYTRNEL